MRFSPSVGVMTGNVSIQLVTRSLKLIGYSHGKIELRGCDARRLAHLQYQGHFVSRMPEGHAHKAQQQSARRDSRICGRPVGLGRSWPGQRHCHGMDRFGQCDTARRERKVRNAHERRNHGESEGAECRLPNAGKSESHKLEFTEY